MHVMSVRRAVAAAALACCACADDRVYLMHEVYLVDADGAEQYQGGGCETVDFSGHSSSGFGTAPNPDSPQFSVTHAYSDEGAHVTVRSESGAVLSERQYAEAFLEAGKEDTFSIRVTDSTSLRLKYWGGPTCVPPRDVEDES